MAILLAGMRSEGRIVISGGISSFEEPTQLILACNRHLFTSKRLTMKAYPILRLAQTRAEFQKAVGDHLLAG